MRSITVRATGVLCGAVTGLTGASYACGPRSCTCRLICSNTLVSEGASVKLHALRALGHLLLTAEGCCSALWRDVGCALMLEALQ